jgi:hypothetical protein
MNIKKHTVIYLLGLPSIVLALTFMILPDYHSVLAQQQITTNPIGTSNVTQQQNQNWTGSISLFSPILDALKSKIHTTLNDATTNAMKAAGGSNASAIAAFIHRENGFLVYDVFVLDSNNNVHRVIVDPGNGKVLSSQIMSLMDMMSKVHSAPAPGDLIIAPFLIGDGISTPELSMLPGTIDTGGGGNPRMMVSPGMLLGGPITTGGNGRSNMMSGPIIIGPGGPAVMMVFPGMLLRLPSEPGIMAGPIDTGGGGGGPNPVKP